jgi:rod shape-determining protein MreC
VGTVTSLRSDDSRAFLVGELEPAAQLDRGRDVLLLRSAPNRLPALPAASGVDGVGVVALGASTVSDPAAHPLVEPSTAAAAATQADPATDPAAGHAVEPER